MEKLTTSDLVNLMKSVFPCLEGNRQYPSRSDEQILVDDQYIIF